MKARLPMVLVVVLAVVVVAISGTPWRPAFVNPSGGPTVVVAVLVAAVLSVAIPLAVAGAVGRRLPWSIGASALGWVVAGLVVAVTPVFSFSAFGDGLTSALARLLQSTPPLVVEGGTLLPAFTLVWLAGAVVGELLARTRVVLGLVAPPLVGFGLAYAATAELYAEDGFGGGPVVWSFVILAVGGLLVAMRRLSLDVSTVESESTAEIDVALRNPARAIAMLAVAGLIAAVVVPRLPGVSEEPVGLDREPPLDQPAPDSPVEVMTSYRRSEGLVRPPVVDEVLLRVEFDERSSGYLTVANLDDYDGAGWRFDRRFDPTGFAVPGDNELSPALVRQRIEVVRALPFAEQWLPALDRPVEVPPFDARSDAGVSTVQAVYDPATGMVLSPVPIGAGTTYSVLSRVAASGLDQIDRDTPVASTAFAAPAATTAILRDPAGLLADWNGAVEEGLGDPLVGDVESLVSLRTWMRDRLALTGDDEELEIQLAGGESEPLVRSLALRSIHGKILRGDGKGTPEQIATMYVLLARQLGVPARLATGFRIVDESERDSGLPAGTYDVTGAEAWTWAEVLIGDEGWIVVDPSPPVDQEVPPSTTTTEPEGAKQEEDKPNEDLTAILPNPVAEPPPPIEPPTPWFAIVLGILALIGLVVFAIVAGMRRRLRRKARRKGDPRQQVMGAWQEILDQLDEADLGPLAPLSGTEVAAAASERFGADVGAPVAGIATLSTPAVYSTQPISEAAATEAWQNLEAARTAIRRNLAPRQRFAATLRSLRRRPV